MQEFTLKTTEQVRLVANPTKTDGSPSAIDPNTQMSATLVTGDGATAPGNSASEVIVAANTVGDHTFNVDADADLGAGVVTISEVVVLHVLEELAANLGLSGGVEPRTI
jgi:hypothetical protein